MPADLWTEHMLPVKWTEEWPFEDEEFVERLSGEPKAEQRKRTAPYIGQPHSC